MSGKRLAVTFARRWVLLWLLLGLFVLVGQGVMAQEAIDHNWLTAVADDALDTDPSFAAIAIDSQDRPHIAYRRAAGDGALYYAHQDEADNWQIEPVDDTPFSGQYVAIALDVDGQPAISHTTNTSILMSRRTADGWAPSETIFAGDITDLPGPTRLAAAGGVLHLSYYLNDQLFYTQNSGGGWDVPLVVADAVGFYHDLALDAGGNPHVVYQVGENSLVYQGWADGDWGLPEDVASGTFLGEYNGLVLDETGQPHVSFLGDDVLQYATRQDGTWVSEIVHANAPVAALYTNILLHEDGTPTLVYYDLDGAQLLYSQQNETDGWSQEIIDGGGDVGWAAAATLDGRQRIHIAYFDLDTAALKHAVWNWAPTAVDDSASLWVDGSTIIPVLANDVDRDERPLTPQIVAQPQHGDVLLTPEGSAVYVPQRGYRGADQFTYEITDHGGLRDTAVVDITVFVPTLIFVDETEKWIPNANGSKIQLQLADGTANTWAGVQFFNERNGRWETVRGADGQPAWHGTADNMHKRPWVQTWWLGEERLGTGPYRWVIYSAPNGYARVYSEPFFLPEQTNRMLVMNGRVR